MKNQMSQYLEIKKMNKILLFILLITISLNYQLFSQRETVRLENSGVTPGGIGVTDGKVMLNQSSDLLRLVKLHKEKNNNTFPGWRVQIYFGSSRTAMDVAKETKRRFADKFGTSYGSYVIYDAPYFKVRVGDFRSRAEAMNFEQKIKPMFPSSWVVPDKVKYPDRNLAEDEEDTEDE